MRIAAAITLSSEQQATLEQWARSRSLPLRVVERAHIVLRAAAGQQDKGIASAMKITQKKASRWRKRFLTLGMAGLEQDAPRPGRRPTITASLIRRVVHRTTQQKPLNATHWSTRSMAQAAGISEASVRRIWHSHGLKPHRVESFKISNDPEFHPCGEFKRCGLWGSVTDVTTRPCGNPELGITLSLSKHDFRMFIISSRVSGQVSFPSPIQRLIQNLTCRSTHSIATFPAVCASGRSCAACDQHRPKCNRSVRMTSNASEYRCEHAIKSHNQLASIRFTPGNTSS